MPQTYMRSNEHINSDVNFYVEMYVIQIFVWTSGYTKKWLLGHWRFGSDSVCLISENLLRIKLMNTSGEIRLRWMSQHFWQ